MYIIIEVMFSLGKFEIFLLFIRSLFKYINFCEELVYIKRIEKKIKLG